MEAGASGASGRRAARTVQCGGAGSAPSPHLARGAKTAKGLTSSLSTVPVSSARRVSATPPTRCRLSRFNSVDQQNRCIFGHLLAVASVDGCFDTGLLIITELMRGKLTFENQ